MAFARINVHWHVRIRKYKCIGNTYIWKLWMKNKIIIITFITLRSWTKWFNVYKQKLMCYIMKIKYYIVCIYMSFITLWYLRVLEYICIYSYAQFDWPTVYDKFQNIGEWPNERTGLSDTNSFIESFGYAQKLITKSRSINMFTTVQAYKY